MYLAIAFVLCAFLSDLYASERIVRSYDYGESPFSTEILPGQTLRMSCQYSNVIFNLTENANPTNILESVDRDIDAVNTINSTLFYPHSQLSFMDPERDWYFQNPLNRKKDNSGIFVLCYKKNNLLPYKTGILGQNKIGKTSHIRVGFLASIGNDRLPPNTKSFPFNLIEDRPIEENSFCAVDGRNITVKKSIFHLPNSMRFYLQAQKLSFNNCCISYRQDCTNLSPQSIIICPNANLQTPFLSLEIYPREGEPVILNGDLFTAPFNFSVAGAESFSVLFKKEEREIIGALNIGLRQKKNNLLFKGQKELKITFGSLIESPFICGIRILFQRMVPHKL